jgi:hypothetical protein
MSAPTAPPIEPPLERGRASILEDPPAADDRAGSPPPPRDPGPGPDFPRFRGGDGGRLPNWQRWLLLAGMFILSALIGAFLGNMTRALARGLEAGRRPSS